MRHCLRFHHRQTNGPTISARPIAAAMSDCPRLLISGLGTVVLHQRVSAAALLVACAFGLQNLQQFSVGRSADGGEFFFGDRLIVAPSSLQRGEVGRVDIVAFHATECLASRLTTLSKASGEMRGEAQ